MAPPVRRGLLARSDPKGSEARPVPPGRRVSLDPLVRLALPVQTVPLAPQVRRDHRVNTGSRGRQEQQARRVSEATPALLEPLDLPAHRGSGGCRGNPVPLARRASLVPRVRSVRLAPPVRPERERLLLRSPPRPPPRATSTSPILTPPGCYAG